MDQLTCCKNSSWVPERDLEHAAGFEYMLGKCGNGGTHWINVFCVASGVTGYERVMPSDVEAIRAIPDGPELRGFMRRWETRPSECRRMCMSISVTPTREC